MSTNLAVIQGIAAPHSFIRGLFTTIYWIGTLDLLISLSEDLPKQELFTGTVAKTVDTLRNLLNNDPSKLAQHILVNEKSVDDYILNGWKWNEGRYGVQRGLREMVDVLNKVCWSVSFCSNALTVHQLRK